MATETFAPNTLIIPMQEAFQNNGMWLAYGLVYKLLSTGIPVKWAIKPGKAYNGTDFIATTQDIKTLTAYISQAYTGGPFIIDSAQAAAALPVISAWQAANPAVTVHRATAGFTAPIAATMNRKPRIAVEETNSGIVTTYLNTAKIPDSNGNTWPSSSPDILSPDEIGNGAFFGYNETDPCKQLVYDIFLSPHTSDGTWTDPVNSAQLDTFVKIGGFIHSMCHSISAIENFAGPFLTTAGFGSFGNKGDSGTFTVDVPDYPSAQAVPTSGKVQVLPGGSEQTWLHTSVTYLPSTQVLAHFLDNGTQYDFMVGGSYKGGTGAGKVVYEGGHQYAVTLPYSNNAEGPYLRFFYDSLFFSVSKPRIVLLTVPRNIPAGSPTTVTFVLANDGGSPAAGLTASVTLAPGVVYNAGSASVTPTSIVGQTLSWDAAALAAHQGPGTVVTFTAQVTPPGPGIQSIATYTANFADSFNETYTMPQYCASVNATPGASPNVVKTPLTQTKNPSQSVSWTITAVNNGTLPLNNVIITDTLPAGLTFVSAVPAPSSISGGGANPTILTWQSPQIPASLAALGGSVSITLNATTPPATTATFTNSVNLSGTDTTPAQYSVDASATLQVINRPPAVTILTPSPNTLVCQGTNVTWTASDPDGDSLTYSLEYSSDGGTTYNPIPGASGLVGTSYFWDTSALPSGTNYYVKVIASDGELTGEAAVGPLTIDNTPPTVNWVSPINGSFLTSTPVLLQASATDNVGVTGVEFQYSNDGFITFTSIGTDTTPVGNVYSTNWEITGLFGNYQVKAIASDQCGKKSETVINVTVDLPPAVDLTAPIPGQLVCPPGTTITWTSSSPSGAPLTYTLLYSNNGGVTYTQIASGLTGNSYIWSTAGLPSGTNYFIKIVASDGLLTSEDTTGPFTVDNTPPTVNFTSPTNGALITTSPVTLSASAVDNVAVAGVQFQYSADGGITFTNINGMVTVPTGTIYSINWDFSSLPKGSYQLRAVATDTCGETGQSTITVTADLRPTVDLLSPNGGEIICPQGTTITWTAQDPNGDTLTYALLYSSDGGTTFVPIVTGLTGVCFPAPCSYNWDTSGLPSGTGYLVKIIASDGILTAEDVSNSTFTIDNTPPAVTMLSPLNNTFVHNTVTVSAQATDNISVTGVLFEYSNDGGTTWSLIGNVAAGLGDIYSINWNTVLLPSGPYIIRATASDQCNQTAVSTVNVTVDNTPPTVQIPSPPNGSEVSGEVPILVTGQDNECLARIDLYIDGQLVFTETFAPAKTGEFVFDWDTMEVTEGTHVVKAVATDCAGLTSETQNTYVVNNLPDHYQQLLVDGSLTIPPQKPDVEKIIDFDVTTRVEDINIFNTIDGTKVTVRGFAEIGVTYSATGGTQEEHFAEFEVPFNAMILYPGLPLDAVVEPVIFVEHKQWHLLDARTIKKDIVLFVGIKQVC